MAVGGTPNPPTLASAPLTPALAHRRLALAPPRRLQLITSYLNPFFTNHRSATDKYNFLTLIQVLLSSKALALV